MADSIQAQITASIKAALKTITKENGYNYDVLAVEQARKKMEINSRWDFILLLENEPVKDNESLIIRELEYPIWFFSRQNDELVRDPDDPTEDTDTEIAYYNRNIIADITKALNIDPTRGNLAEITEVIPGTHSDFITDDLILFGTWCLIKVVTSIDSTNPYLIRSGT